MEGLNGANKTNRLARNELGQYIPQAQASIHPDPSQAAGRKRPRAGEFSDAGARADTKIATLEAENKKLKKEVTQASSGRDRAMQKLKDEREKVKAGNKRIKGLEKEVKALAASVASQDKKIVEGEVKRAVQADHLAIANATATANREQLAADLEAARMEAKALRERVAVLEVNNAFLPVPKPHDQLVWDLQAAHDEAKALREHIATLENKDHLNTATAERDQGAAELEAARNDAKSLRERIAALEDAAAIQTQTATAELHRRLEGALDLAAAVQQDNRDLRALLAEKSVADPIVKCPKSSPGVGPASD